jgi:carbamoyltransferase
MNILGINGYDDWFHDPSACLLKDGKLIFFIEEERLIRKKNAIGQVPTYAVQKCLVTGNLSWNDIDIVAVGWDIPLLASRLEKPLPQDTIVKNLLHSLGAPQDFPTNRVIFISHHEAHAWSGLCLCPEQQALVLIIDGQGDTESTSVFRYSNGQLQPLITLDARFSLGYFYEGASWFVGLNLDGAGKLMGLAAYANEPSVIAFDLTGESGYSTLVPTELTATFDDNLDHAKSVVNGFWIPYFSRLYPKLAWENLPVELPKIYREQLASIPEAIKIAGLAQETVEKVVLNIINTFIADADSAIVLAGGVALNCKMNGVIAEAYPDRDIFIQPASHDAGVALGAAIATSRQFGEWPLLLQDFPYTGSSYSDLEIQEILKDLGVKFEQVHDIAEIASDLIVKEKVIGWFQGRAEVGPRALGARSILARPDSLAIRDRINREIKGRERWRPLSPAVLDRFGNKLFESYKFSPYMLLGYKVTPLGKKILAGTIHIDGTARPQSISPSVSPQRFYSLVEAVFQKTDIPSVLNTSFNLAGEPIVNTPHQAVDTFQRSNLDALVIGDCIVNR